MWAGSLNFIDRFSTDKKRSITRMSNHRPRSIEEHHHLINLYYLNILNFGFVSLKNSSFILY